MQPATGGGKLFPKLPNLPEELACLVRQVPPGRVTTYGWLAEALGDAAAARWIGQFLGHPHPALSSGEDCPCHRVVRSDGKLGLYGHGSPDEKEQILRREGIRLAAGRVDLERVGFKDFRSARPLAALKELQEQLAERVRLQPLGLPVRTVAGVDVAYTDDQAGGAYVAMDPAGRQILWEKLIRQVVEFPYISGFLAFRELPVFCRLLELAREAGYLADVILVDGSGIIHPRGAGIASHLGVLWEIPTIGVTKTRLCGSLQPACKPEWISYWVIHQQKKLGFAFRPRPGGNRLVYVSPGHLVDLQSCLAVVGKLLHGRRLPEPLYHADRKSKQARAI